MRLWTVIFFFFSLPLGQLGGFNLSPGTVIYVHDIALLMLLGLAAGELGRGRKINKPQLLGPIVLFLLAGLMSLAINAYRFSLVQLGQSALYLVRWLVYALLYLVIVGSSVKSHFWLWGIYGFGVALAVLGLGQYIFYPDLRNLSYMGWDPHYGRLFSTFLDPNFTGIVLVLTFFLGIFLWFSQRPQRRLLILYQVLIFLALLLTYSRSSYLALLVGLAVWLVGTHKIKLALVSLGVLLVLFLLLPLPRGDALRITRPDSSLARLVNWKTSFELFRQTPIWGIGFNTLRWHYQDRGLDASGVSSRAVSGVDSSLLFVAVTSGLVGLMAYGYLWFKFFVLARKSFRKDKNLTWFYLASLIALLTHSLFVNSLFYPWVMLWFWTVTGVLEKEQGFK